MTKIHCHGPTSNHGGNTADDVYFTCDCLFQHGKMYVVIFVLKNINDLLNDKNISDANLATVLGKLLKKSLSMSALQTFILKSA